jgi:hypothetical protein
VGIGSISSLFYIFTLKEPSLVKQAKKLQKEFKKNQVALFKEEESAQKSMLSAHVKNWYHWFQEG